jgi:hypothetical protein
MTLFNCRYSLLSRWWMVSTLCWKLWKAKNLHESNCGLFDTRQFSINGPGKTKKSKSFSYINPLNAELHLICHLVALLEAYHILHVSRIRVKRDAEPPKYAVGMLTIWQFTDIQISTQPAVKNTLTLQTPTAYFSRHQSSTGTHARLNTPSKHEATVEWLWTRLSLGRCPVQISCGTSNILNKFSSVPPCNFRSSASKYDTAFSKSYQIYHPSTALLIDAKQPLILTA